MHHLLKEHNKHYKDRQLLLIKMPSLLTDFYSAAFVCHLKFLISYTCINRSVIVKTSTLCLIYECDLNNMAIVIRYPDLVHAIGYFAQEIQ